MKKVTFTVDLEGVQADAVVVDALARLALALRRRDQRLCVQNAPSELTDLVDFMGLSDVLGVEVKGQIE